MDAQSEQQSEQQGEAPDVGEGVDATAGGPASAASPEPEPDDETGAGAEAPDDLGGTGGVDAGGAG